MTTDDFVRQIDEFVYDPCKLPYRGWHDDNSDKRGTPEYRPVIQQVRSEFAAFLEQVRHRRLDGTAVQIGLGIGGGSHFAFSALFQRVLTVDIDPVNIDRFRAFCPDLVTPETIIQGSSFDPEIIARARATAAGADLLFIDGGHLFTEVRQDWENFHDIVRPGGLVCVHDSVPRPARYHELQIDIFLAWLEHQPFGRCFERIGSTLGIAYYRV